jgi:large subunit ribosomal protein L6
MEKKKQTSEKIVVPGGVSFSLEGRNLKAKGPQGEVERIIDDPLIEVKVEGAAVHITAQGTSKRESRKIGTWKSHIKNMCKGSLDGYTYKLKICSGHFPMNVSATDKEFIVKNFLGEKVPRKVVIHKGASIKVDGEVVTVQSASKELAGQTAADIEQLCRIVGRDSRIFQDGIWIFEKDTKSVR